MLRPWSLDAACLRWRRLRNVVCPYSRVVPVVARILFFHEPGRTLAGPVEEWFVGVERLAECGDERRSIERQVDHEVAMRAGLAIRRLPSRRAQVAAEVL